ncbi:MAG: hypothetical protein Kow0069_32010 [Promethearchaeota archaeon]
MPKVYKNPNRPKVKRKAGAEKEPIKDEDKLYWAKTLMGLGSGFVELVSPQVFYGWRMLLWMLAFWFLAPIPVGLLIRSYDKEEWDWKVIEKTAVGSFFATFMLVSTIVHTLLRVAGLTAYP